MLISSSTQSSFLCRHIFYCCKRPLCIHPSISHPLQQQLTMTRTLLDSSWIRFGPAGDGLDGWKTGRLPTQEQQINTWPDVELEEDRGSELALYICLPIVSVFLLALLAGLVYQRWFRHKLSLANIIALDVQDADANAEFLASLTRNAERHTSTSSDGSEGVFVMVYLPPPYEETLTKITRAASLSSSRDVEAMKIENLEAMLGPELKHNIQTV